MGVGAPNKRRWPKLASVVLKLESAAANSKLASAVPKLESAGLSPKLARDALKFSVGGGGLDAKNLM